MVLGVIMNAVESQHNSNTWAQLVFMSLTRMINPFINTQLRVYGKTYEPGDLNVLIEGLGPKR